MAPANRHSCMSWAALAMQFRSDRHKVRFQQQLLDHDDDDDDAIAIVKKFLGCLCQSAYTLFKICSCRTITTNIYV